MEFDLLPTIKDGVLALAGKTRNGARFENERDLMVQVFYDPPPHPLTKGQVSRTYCYDSGLAVARLREPLTGGWYYDEREYSKTHSPRPGVAGGSGPVLAERILHNQQHGREGDGAVDYRIGVDSGR